MLLFSNSLCFQVEKSSTGIAWPKLSQKATACTSEYWGFTGSIGLWHYQRTQINRYKVGFKQRQGTHTTASEAKLREGEEEAWHIMGDNNISPWPFRSENPSVSPPVFRCQQVLSFGCECKCDSSKGKWTAFQTKTILLPGKKIEGRCAFLRGICSWCNVLSITETLLKQLHFDISF